MSDFQKDYEKIRRGGFGYKKFPRGLIEVSGAEAVQFLNGLLTNDVAALNDNAEMLAAFPNAQGRLLALVRILRRGDKFLFETEEATHEKIFQNLFRFTFAGDFSVKDLSEDYVYFSLWGSTRENFTIENAIIFQGKNGAVYFVPKENAEIFREKIEEAGAFEISDELYQVLRIENGMPVYGIDMDETTVVLETGLDEAVSFNKGCYIGQEIIARIHFRGHVAKKLTGLIFEGEAGEIKHNDEVKSTDGKNAGRVTSVTFSPALGKQIAIAFVRYNYLAEDTKLKVNEIAARVKNFPFVNR